MPSSIPSSHLEHGPAVAHVARPLRRGMPSLLRWASALGTALLAATAYGAPLCVFDIIGANGDAANMAKDYVVALQNEGLGNDYRIYTNEAAAVEDFKAGRCLGVFATAFRTRPFNPVSASTDTLGATTIVRDGRIDMASSYEVMRKLIQVYSSPSPSSQKMMIEGNYEVGGILPIGAAYPLVADRRVDTVEELAGKRIAALDYDPAQAIMIKRIKAVPVPTDIGNLPQRFTSGAVDMIAIPALAYKPFNLDRYVADKGGFTRFPLMILTYQLILNRSMLPPEFGQKSRAYWLSQFDRALQLIKRSEDGIPRARWVELPPEEIYKHTLMLREARIDIAAAGVYDKRGLKVLKKVRCHVNPADPECATRSEEDWK